MRKVNTDTMVEDSWSSSKGKFAGAGKQVSEALGRNPSSTDLMADNPIGESNYFPDSGKWFVRSPERRLIRSEALEYHDGEE
jgi:hypothetical protein